MTERVSKLTPEEQLFQSLPPLVQDYVALGKTARNEKLKPEVREEMWRQQFERYKQFESKDRVALYAWDDFQLRKALERR